LIYFLQVLVSIYFFLAWQFTISPDSDSEYFTVAHKIPRMNHADLKFLHQILFGRFGKVHLKYKQRAFEMTGANFRCGIYLGSYT
jgi:transposase